MPNLTVITGPAAGETLELEGELVIGREHADLDIADPEISRRHVAIRVVDGGVEVEDLGSLNGTFVNGERISQRVTVDESAKLRIGTSEMLVVAEPEPEPAGETEPIAQPDVTAPRAAIPQPDVTAPRRAIREPEPADEGEPIAQPDVTAPREIPQPDVTAPRKAIPEPDVTAPRGSIPQPDVTAPREVPQPDVTAPRGSIPQPDVTAPRQTVPQPDVTAPRQVPTGPPESASTEPAPAGAAPERAPRTGPSPAVLIGAGMLVGAVIVVLIVLLA
jgi:predicted component of type VI protein secretion system